MISKLWAKMYRNLDSLSPYDSLDRELMIQSISCVDVCLYDVIGKALGVPVYKLIGGHRDKVPLILVQYYEKAETFTEQLEELRARALTIIECMNYVTSGSVDRINPDIIRVGGITDWVRIANNADYYNVKMTAHACIEATLQVFGGTPNATWVTQQTPWRDPFWSGGELVESVPKPIDGCVSLPDVPGMGYRIKEEAVEKYKIREK